MSSLPLIKYNDICLLLAICRISKIKNLTNNEWYGRTDIHIEKNVLKVKGKKAPLKTVPFISYIFGPTKGGNSTPLYKGTIILD